MTMQATPGGRDRRLPDGGSTDPGADDADAAAADDGHGMPVTPGHRLDPSHYYVLGGVTLLSVAVILAGL